MKHLLFAAFLLIWGSNSYAQERENKALPEISNTVLWSLDDATGWTHTTDGQWLSSKKRILVLGLSSTQVSEYNKPENNIGLDNFYKWEARDIKIEGQQFLLITKEMIVGEYKYPDQKAGFNTSHKTVFSVIKKNGGFFDSGLNQAGPSYRAKMYGWGEVVTGPNTLHDIGVVINSDVMAMGAKTFLQGSTVNFELFYSLNQKPENCRFFIKSSDEGLNPYRRQILPMPGLLFVHAEYLYFKQCYYELPTANLAGLVDLIKPLK